MNQGEEGKMKYIEIQKEIAEPQQKLQLQKNSNSFANIILYLTSWKQNSTKFWSYNKTLETT